MAAAQARLAAIDAQLCEPHMYQSGSETTVADLLKEQARLRRDLATRRGILTRRRSWRWRRCSERGPSRIGPQGVLSARIGLVRGPAADELVRSGRARDGLPAVRSRRPPVKW